MACQIVYALPVCTLSCMCLGFLLPIRISVLVGAPKANTSQPGIMEAGAVYYCPWPGLPESCRQIPFDNSSELPETRFQLLSLTDWSKFEINPWFHYNFICLIWTDCEPYAAPIIAL